MLLHAWVPPSCWEGLGVNESGLVRASPTSPCWESEAAHNPMQANRSSLETWTPGLALGGMQRQKLVEVA